MFKQDKTKQKKSQCRGNEVHGFCKVFILFVQTPPITQQMLLFTQDFVLNVLLGMLTGEVINLKRILLDKLEQLFYIRRGRSFLICGSKKEISHEPFSQHSIAPVFEECLP
jgi:hypothetical protein